MQTELKEFKNVTSGEHLYTCTDKDCYFYQRMGEVRLSREVPKLPIEYMAEIGRHGGWYAFRDAAIAENSKYILKKLKTRVSYHIRMYTKKKLAA